MPPTIQVTVKLFAIYQEVLGRPELTLHLPPQSPVAAVLEHLIQQHPELAPWQSQTQFGLNLAVVPPTTLLQDQDEVVLIPPVSGG